MIKKGTLNFCKTSFHKLQIFLALIWPHRFDIKAALCSLRQDICKLDNNEERWQGPPNVNKV